MSAPPLVKAKESFNFPSSPSEGNDALGIAGDVGQSGRRSPLGPTAVLGLSFTEMD